MSDRAGIGWKELLLGHFWVVLCGGASLGAIGSWSTQPTNTPEAVEQKRAYEAALLRFDELGVADPDNAVRGGLTDVRVFGYHRSTCTAPGGRAAETTREEANGPFEVVIPCCVAGAGTDGANVSRYAAVHIRLTQRQPWEEPVGWRRSERLRETYEVTDVRIEPGEEVSAAILFGFWLRQSTIIPLLTFPAASVILLIFILVSIGFPTLGGLFKGETSPGGCLMIWVGLPLMGAAVGVPVCAIVNSAYTAYVCSSSYLLAAVCFVGEYLIALAAVLFIYGVCRAAREEQLRRAERAAYLEPFSRRSW
ncbi:MAG: hypothetical protein U0736_13515 [Gemmataceae bacterium]